MNASLTLSSTQAFFGNNSPLKQAALDQGRTYEERPQQTAMAIEVARALTDQQHLCVEAPTGVGKSLAYLIPALYHAKTTGKKVIISTHTISLQEQLLIKDLALLHRIIPFEFKSALAKGRENYLCLRRLYLAYHKPEEYLLADDQTNEIQRIMQWSQQTEDGTKSDLEPQPAPRAWSQVNCEPGNCLSNKCAFFKKCHFMKMKQELASADLIVTNHALFFVDLAMKASQPGSQKATDGLLPNFGAVIFDEAHTIEESAAMHLGVKISSGGFFQTLNRLFNPYNQRGLLALADGQTAREACEKLRTRAELFFGNLGDWLAEQEDNPLRYTIPNHIPHLLQPDLVELDELLDNMLEDLKSDDERKQELRVLKERLFEYNQALQIILSMSHQNHVYWMEYREYDQNRRNVSLYGVPVDINQVLRPILFNSSFTVTLTSATLAVNNTLNFYLNRIGATGIRQLILDSPYNYQEQVELYLPMDMPAPKDYKAFQEAVCEKLEDFLMKTEGRALVLFTSYSMMNETARRMQYFFEEKRLQLLMQGGGHSRTAIVQHFQNSEKAVIFGTSSFWTGIDIPGQSLSNVIIVRMPFAVPSHPLHQARMESLESHGISAFRHYSLPEAILKFRQGFGRLIRSRSDRGIVVILDSRITTTSYGRSFLDSLPPCQQKTF